jgi:hypothetical protein
MKALFYDRSQKCSSTSDNETKKYSTQTYTKGIIKILIFIGLAFFIGSVAIIKVNNIDHYIDIENDGWTEKDQNMTGWMLRRDADKKSKIIYEFPENFILKCRSNVRVLCGKKSDIEEKEKEILIDEDTKSWDIGSHVVTYLIDNNGEEKASVIQTLVPL